MLRLLVPIDETLLLGVRAPGIELTLVLEVRVSGALQEMSVLLTLTISERPPLHNMRLTTKLPNFHNK